MRSYLVFSEIVSQFSLLRDVMQMQALLQNNILSGKNRIFTIGLQSLNLPKVITNIINE